MSGTVSILKIPKNFGKNWEKFITEFQNID